MIALAIVLSLGIGLSLGLLGGGGSILTLPILVYVAGVDTKDAISMSLVVVGLTSLTALVPHARAGNVDWRAGAVFVATGMLAAFAGGRFAAALDGRTLLLAFAGVMVVAALGMLRPRSEPDPSAAAQPLWKVLGVGLGVGAMSGLLGAGGGFLIVPALVLLAQLPTKRAIGTSLLVIAANSAAGFVGHAAHAHLDLGLTAAITAVAVVGSVAGSRIANSVRPQQLRRAFAVLVLAMAVVQVGMEW